MKKNKKTKNSLFTFPVILIGAIFMFFGSMAFAAGGVGDGGAGTDDEEERREQCVITASKGSVVDLNAVAECMENRYGYDKDMLRRAKKKGISPEIDMHFDKTNPSEGQEVTAMAIGKYFRNDIDDLYYTWYIRHTDAAGNFTNTLSEGKQEAMGIIARGKYDPRLFGEDYSADTDGDGGFGPFGGYDGVGAKVGWGTGEYDDSPDVLWDVPKMIVASSAITRCYAHNFGNKFGSGEDGNSGRDMIIPCEHEWPNCGGHITGDGNFSADEERCWNTDPTNPDTDGDGIRDELDIMGLGQQEFTWTYRAGDHVGVVIEGTSLSTINEGGMNFDNYVDCEWSTLASSADGSISCGGSGTRDEALAACRDCLQDDLETITEETTTGTETSTGTQDPVTGATTGTTVVDITTEGTETTDLTEQNNGIAAYDACEESLQRHCIHLDPNESDEDILEQLEDDGALNMDGATNAYYKIMWAHLDFVGEGDRAGFGYKESISIDEKGEELLEPAIDYAPKNPQYDSIDSLNSDIITVTAGVNNDNVDEDFLYYNWRVRKCVADDLFECPYEMTGAVEWESFNQGLGVKKIKFIPTSDLFESGETKVWLKVNVVVSQHEDYVGGAELDLEQDYFPVGAIDEVMMTVTRNDMNLRLFRAFNNGGTWTVGDEICAAGVYRDICPLYPFEVVAARAETPSAEMFAWQLNDEQLQPPLECLMSSGCNVYEDTVFFPVFGSGKSLGTISATANGIGNTNIISQRIFSIFNPVGVLVSGSANLTPTERYDGAPSEFVYESAAGETVSLFVDSLIPSYLDWSEVNIQWYINGIQAYDGIALVPDFVVTNPSLNLTVSPDRRTISFVNDGLWGKGLEVACRIEKLVDSVDLLERGWAIRDSHTLVQDTNVNVKVAFDATFEAAPIGSRTLQKFLASSLHNAPQYLIFIVRLAVAMVLVWSILFGVSYAVKLNE
ncbi:MAG: hypothetical protein U9O20_01255 [Patescibacteria group bacterium]|nr:hypothetical protein [Patescibacteria group bacterium]